MRPGRPAYPRHGALRENGGVHFCVWAPAAGDVQVILEPTGQAYPLTRDGAGYWQAFVAGLEAGAQYRYRLDGAPAVPDPASRRQPHGVHGPSTVVDPESWRWRDGTWRGRPQEDLVFYELHVGTFTAEGTFEGVRRRLPYLQDLGVTALELMPVSDFPGRWNWGYDSAALFAPSRAYGSPDDLRALVDEAHQRGLSVFLDVVYNHFGPDGAYAPGVSPAFFSSRHRTPWGPAVNLDGEGSGGVRAFFIDNALHWLAEYHLDGLRLDAVHAIADESPRHFLAELAEAVRGLPLPRRFLIAEDHRNLNRVALPVEADGYGLDGVWSDDYHHQVRRVLTGDRDGYLVDFSDATRDLATIIRQGWLFTGQHSSYFGGRRGTDPRGIRPWRFLHFLQNHDQIGNGPQGDRISRRVEAAVYRAATALLLFPPELPLLFMGQEWAARTPFCYFTDHTPELGRKVTAGRRKEFARFAGFAGAIPDPQDPETFSRSALDWTEPEREPHAGILRLHQDLLRLRPQLDGAFAVHSPVEGGVWLRRGAYVLLVALRDGVSLPLPPTPEGRLHTEEPRYASDPMPPQVGGDAVFFPRAAALLLTSPAG